MGVRQSKQFLLQYFDLDPDNYWHLWISSWFVQRQLKPYVNA